MLHFFFFLSSLLPPLFFSSLLSTIFLHCLFSLLPFSTSFHYFFSLFQNDVTSLTSDLDTIKMNYEERIREASEGQKIAQNSTGNFTDFSPFSTIFLYLLNVRTCITSHFSFKPFFSAKIESKKNVRHKLRILE